MRMRTKTYKQTQALTHMHAYINNVSICIDYHNDRQTHYYNDAKEGFNYLVESFVKIVPSGLDTKCCLILFNYQLTT